MRLLVNIDVNDLEQAVGFYQDALGLRQGRRLFENSVAEMLGATSTIYLLAREAGTPASPMTSAVRDYHRHWTPVHLDFEVEDIAAAVRRSVAAGAMLDGEIHNFAWGRLATLSDPFGHGYCLLQFHSQDYDTAACDDTPL